MDNQQKPPEYQNGKGYEVIDVPKKRKNSFAFLFTAIIIIFALYSIWNIITNKWTYSNANVDVINIEQISKIKIDSLSDVYVVPSNDNNLKVTINGDAAYEPKYRSEINGRSLSIEFNKNFVLLFGYSRMAITIEVPESYNGDFDVKTSAGLIDFDITNLSDLSISSSSGSVSVGNIDCDELDIKASSGKISVKDIVSDELEVNASSGSISISSITAENVDLKSSSGSISVDYLYAEESDINCSSGKITVNDVRNTSLNAKSSSGSIYVEYAEFNSDIDVSLDASSGSITLSLPQSSQFNLDARTSSGSINCDFDIVTSSNDKNKLSGITEGGANNSINLKASSGSIKIKKN